MPTTDDPMGLASALHLLGRAAQAEAAYREILARTPGDRAARNNLIALLTGEGRFTEAEAAMREGVALFPADMDLKLRLALSVLAGGDYAEGWALFEARRGAWASNGVIPPALSIPEWQGEPVDELLVWPEMGFGDMIQFARFVPELERRGIKPTLLCPPELSRLFRAAGLNAVAMTDGANVAPHPAWAFIGSLPLRLGATLETLPPPLPIDVAAIGPAGGVGFVGAGRPVHKNDANRSLPAAFIEAMLKLPATVSLNPADTGAVDFLDTAGIVAALDHVITVDTSVAHLAGSMGKPVSLLLPNVGTDWRWLRERTDSPWYPSVRLYRQAVPGRWRAVLDEVLGDLGELAERPAPSRAPLEIDIVVAPPTATAPHPQPQPQPQPPAAAPAQPAQAEPAVHSELAKRQASVERGETDRRRWEDVGQLDPSWDRRARLAAAYLPRGARVLDLGCGAMALEKVLPEGCGYIPCDLVARDARTLVCDFNKAEFPDRAACDAVVVLGVLEYLYDVPAFLRRVRALGQPLTLSYNLAGGAGPADRRSLGWVNDFTQADLLNLLRQVGFTGFVGDEITPGQWLIGMRPDAPPKAERSVWIVSCANFGNFGDRLGVQVLASVLPANARVRHIRQKPWDAPPEGRPDLLVVGAGGSLFGSLLTPELLELTARAEQSIGLFGTQYRAGIDPARMAALIDRLGTWWARYEEDALLYGAGRGNVRHLGDLMADAFPMTRWTQDATYEVSAEILGNAPMDRTIERIQTYRRVKSSRLHPLLCALTSAEAVSYSEQYEEDAVMASGKFRSLLMDVFGREKPPEVFWEVDRAAVGAYKAKVRAGLDELRADLARWLA